VKISRVGLPWYQEHHYDKLQTLLSDGARLHPTFAAWLDAATKTEQHLARQGHHVVRVDIDPVVFISWCARYGIAPDSQARIRYANDRAYQAEYDARFEDAKAEVYRRARVTSASVERHVTPVFTYRETSRYDFEGTGLLGRLGDRHYFVTAAHVLDACEFGVFLPAVAKGAEPLSGLSIVTARSAGRTREDDRLDIGFIRLSPTEVEQIGMENFLDFANTLDSPPEEPVTVTIALGFPACHQRVNVAKGTLETAITMFMTGLAEQKGYQMAKVNPRSHVLLRYGRNEMIWNGERRGTAPSFKGMSGGGIWPVSLSSGDDPTRQPPLAAMIIEQPAGYATSLLATRAPLIRAFVTRFDTSDALRTYACQRSR
jgi:hypothetical protein